RTLTLNALADLFYETKDFLQATTLGRRALAVSETLPQLDERFTCHNNLANYLTDSGDATNHAEALRHRIAAHICALLLESVPKLELVTENYLHIFRSPH